MAKKKRPAKRPSDNWEPLSLQSMFKEGMKQDSIVLSDQERDALAVIMQARRIGDVASALRFAVSAEAELAKAGRSAEPEQRKTVRRKGKAGRPETEGGGYRYMFPFRTSQAERDAFEVLKEAHGVIKSVAIRHAINQEAKRCRALLAGKSR